LTFSAFADTLGKEKSCKVKVAVSGDPKPQQEKTPEKGEDQINDVETQTGAFFMP
jgi:hypothetical protein